MIKNLRGKKKGFSLVELIVVIAIMGILAAIAVPKFSQYQKNAQKRAAESSAKLVADATFTAFQAGELKTGTAKWDESDITSASSDTNWPKVLLYVSKSDIAATGLWTISKTSSTITVKFAPTDGSSPVSYTLTI